MTDRQPKRRQLRGATSPTTPENLEDADRAVKAMEMRRAGHTFEDIAQHLGYHDKANAHRAVTTLLRSIQAENVEELRALENTRLDRMLVNLQRRLDSGEPRAIEVAIKLLERRARLAGLDAPTKISVSDEDQARAYARSRGLDEEPFLLEWRGLSKG